MTVHYLGMHKLYNTISSGFIESEYTLVCLQLVSVPDDGQATILVETGGQRKNG